MTFSLIVTNPPYGDDKSIKTIGSKKLYQSFAKKAFELVKKDGLVMMVTPQGWFSPAHKGSKALQEARMNLQFELLVAGDHFKQFFGKVGSSFCYFIIKNQPITHPTKLKYYDKDRCYESDTDLNVIFIPKVATPLNISITRKLLIGPRMPTHFGGQIQHSDPFGEGRQTRLPKEPDALHVYPVFHTNSDVRYSKKCHPNQYEKKIIWSSSGYTKPVFDNGILGMSQHAYCVLVNNPEPGLTTLYSKLFQWIFKNWKWSGYGHHTVFCHYLPAVDFTRSWTDQELYQHFGLTDEEIKEIEL